MMGRSIRISCLSPERPTCWRRSWRPMRLRRGAPLAARLAAAALGCLTSIAAAAGYPLTCTPVPAVAADLAAHRITSEALVEDYGARIGRLNPKIHAVI